MKVVYVTIDKQIRDAIHAADTNGRRIVHIELTKLEAAELAGELWPHFRYTTLDSLRPVMMKSGDHYYGVRLEIV